MNRLINVSGRAAGKYRTQYYKFRGVDFSTDPALIDNTRSPDAVNLISDAGGYPQKRLGWRTELTFASGDAVNGLFSLLVSGTEHLIAHVGNRIYRYDAAALNENNEPALLYTTTSTQKSNAFVCRDKLWILTGTEYLVYDGASCNAVSDIAYIPTVITGALPAGGGSALESVNLLQPKRISKYVGNGTSTVYSISDNGFDSIISVSVNGAETTSYTNNPTAGTVTFSTAPAAPSLTGESNVIITWSKNVPGYADSINKCRYAGVYGLGGADSERIFFSGNPDKPNVDWHCETSAPLYQPDPSYIPDDSFAYIGGDENAIMGYSRLGSYQLIIKGASGQDATVYLRSAQLDADGKPTFPLKQGAAGYGAVSINSFAMIGDEPLFLSAHGVIGVETSDITAITSLRNRSYYADAKLTAEANMGEADAVNWDGYYVLALNGHCYILDGKQSRTYQERTGGSYIYECYYWDNVPARRLLFSGGVLRFGTADGRICRFRSDEEKMIRYSDDDNAIVARWATKYDDDGDFGLYKNCGRRWLAVMLNPITRTSAKLYIRTEEGIARAALDARIRIFDFNDIDYDNITFDTSSAPRVFSVPAKTRRYTLMQIIAENDTINEGFGLFGIRKTFTLGGLVKR